MIFKAQKLSNEEFWFHRDEDDWKLKYALLWYQCKICNHWFRYTRMWFRKEYSGYGAGWTARICRDCAKDKTTAMELYNGFKGIKVVHIEGQ